MQQREPRGRIGLSGVRPPAVAGMFYPADARALRAEVERHLAAVPDRGPAPKALIAPHAGYVYSGPVAATGYARLRAARGRVRRVVLIGPAHRVAFRGLAASSAAAFRTPLGDLPVDADALARALELPQVRILDEAHGLEHSLEVQLPFIQVVLGEVGIVPLLAGDARAEEVAEVLEALWDGEETVLVISSDLSHYLDYATAKRIDAETTRAIEALAPQEIGHEQACGRVPISGLLLVARRKGMRPETLDVRNSGDTAGGRDAVVGYGSYAFV